MVQVELRAGLSQRRLHDWLRTPLDWGLIVRNLSGVRVETAFSFAVHVDLWLVTEDAPLESSFIPCVAWLR